MSPTPRMTLVVVEDDGVELEGIRRGMRRLKKDWTLVHFSDGLHALNALDNLDSPIEEPFSILLDLSMPRMNGIEFLAELRKHARFARVPVFVLTTSEDRRDREATAGFGVANYFTKSEVGDDFVVALQAVDSLYRETFGSPRTSEA